jgi:hypothetical protein
MNEIFLNNYTKVPIKKIILIPIFLSYFLISFSQVLSENDIKHLAQKVNTELKGMDIGNGITVRGCYAFGRTLVYQYDVDDFWVPPENMKEDLISNFKEAGDAEVFFNNDVNVDFYYYSGNSLRKKISIKSSEFSNLHFELGDFISINGHPKAKEVNLKIQSPIGWEVEEGDRPNIVKKFVYGTNSYMIIIKDNFAFVSRNEAKEFFNDDEFLSEFISEYSSVFNESEILKTEIVTIDKYPALALTLKGSMERSGINIEMTMKNWIIFFEDKIVFLQCGGLSGKDFNALEGLYNLITNSVIFPEQYNY